MTHLALDLALSTTGIAWGPGPHDHETLCCPSKLRGGERLSWIRRHIAEELKAGVTTIVVEAPFMSRTHPTGAIPLIKLHGAIEHQAWTKGLAFYDVPPATLKSFATGKGNADKVRMLSEARLHGFQGDDHNAADAWWLWKFWAQREALAS